MKDNQAMGGTAIPKAHNSKDTVIIPQIERNYIDTLYLSCNLQDHYSITQVNDVAIDEHYRYSMQRRSLESLYLFGAEPLGDGSGYEWYRLPNYRIGLMDYAKAKRSNQPNCVIQYEHDHLWSLDQNLTGLDLPFKQDKSLYMIKRIDITKTAKLDTDYTVNHGYISSYRGDPLNPKRYGEDSLTVYLGSRKSGNLFRIYNKTKELMQTQSYDKIAKYSAYFGTIQDLYQFEHELHRKYLKDVLGIDTLAQLSDVWMASQSIVSRIRIFPVTDLNRKLIEQNNRKRVQAMRLTPITNYDRPERKRYKRSYRAMVKRMKSELDAYLQSEEGREWESLDGYILLIYDLLEDRMDGKDLTVYVNDSERVKDLKEMYRRHQAMRDGQTDELEREAVARFGAIQAKPHFDD